MTRDDLKWWIGIIGGVAVGLSTSFNVFPWIPAGWQHAISLAAFAWSIISGKMATSPLPGKPSEPSKEP